MRKPDGHGGTRRPFDGIVRLCRRSRFLLPADPGEKSATIGGNISTNAGGMRAVKYGVTRDYIMGLEVVLPDGTITQLEAKL